MLSQSALILLWSSFGTSQNGLHPFLLSLLGPSFAGKFQLTPADWRQSLTVLCSVAPGIAAGERWGQSVSRAASLASSAYLASLDLRYALLSVVESGPAEYWEEFVDLRWGSMPEPSIIHNEAERLGLTGGQKG